MTLDQEPVVVAEAPGPQWGLWQCGRLALLPHGWLLISPSHLPRREMASNHTQYITIEESNRAVAIDNRVKAFWDSDLVLNNSNTHSRICCLNCDFIISVTLIVEYQINKI